MKLNAANRAFVGLVVLSAGAFLLFGLASIALVGAIVYQVASGHGWDWHNHDLRAPLVFLVLVGLGTMLGWRSLQRQVSATKALSRHVRHARVPASPEIVVAASRTRLQRRIDLVAADEPFSFAYGLFFPRIVVSEGLVRSVSPAELDAVLEHERYHVRNLDPIKVLVARVLPSALFYLPFLRDLRRRYIAGRELAADQRALATHGRVALAGALYKVVAGPSWSELGAAAAIGGAPELLDARVRQLETGQEPEMPRLSRLRVLASVVGIGLLVGSFAVALRDLGGIPEPLLRLGSANIGVRAPHSVTQPIRGVLWIAVVVLTLKGIKRRREESERATRRSADRRA